MNKEYKQVNPVTGQVITYTVSDELTKWAKKPHFSPKVERANEFLLSLEKPLSDLLPPDQQ